MQRVMFRPLPSPNARLVLAIKAWIPIVMREYSLKPNAGLMHYASQKLVERARIQTALLVPNFFEEVKKDAVPGTGINNGQSRTD